MQEKDPLLSQEGVGKELYQRVRMTAEQVEFIREEYGIWESLLAEEEQAYAEYVDRTFTKEQTVEVTSVSSYEWVEDKGWMRSRETLEAERASFQQLLKPASQPYIWPIRKVRNAALVPKEYLIEIETEESCYLLPLIRTEINGIEESE